MRRVLGAGIAVAAGAALIAAGPAGATDTGPRIDLRVLVVTDGSAGVDAVVAQLDREGVPYDSVDTRVAGRAPITGGTLTAGSAHARYQGVVLPNESVLAPAELTALADYERGYAVRRIVAYTWAGPHVGQSTVWNGTLDGAALTVTDAAKADGFGYLAGKLGVDDRDAAVPESYAALGVAAAGADFTPLITARTAGGHSGAVAGVYRVSGREQLVLTVAINRHQTHGLLLAHGLVNWLTRGVHLGFWRNWFSVHIDDILLPNYRWDPVNNCTAGAGCGDPDNPPLPTIRMKPADVDTLLSWQRRNGLKLDLAFNAFGSVVAGTRDPLTEKLLAARSSMRWINHTYSHEYLGCVKDESQTPWRCAADPATGEARWASKDEIVQQVNDNIAWARGKRIPIDDSELITGEHSGLRSLPQMTRDNPNLVPALEQTGIRHLAADSSREFGSRLVGSVRTVPRYPMNIFYNAATEAEEIDEYNWIYTRKSDGGSGGCESNASSTCITPLGADGFDTHIVPVEARIAFDHIVSTDPRPHYAHQSNIAEDRVLYPVLDRLLERYRSIFTSATPVVNLQFRAISQLMHRQEVWRRAVASGAVTGYRRGDTVTIVNGSTTTLEVPVTMPTSTRTATVGLGGIRVLGGQFGQAYGGQRSAWHGLARTSGTLTLRLPS